MEDYQNAGKEIAEGTRDLIDAVGLVNDGWGGLVAWFVNLFFKEEEDPCK